MKDIENEYNERFKNKEVPNDNFDVEGLWDAIADDLDQPVPPSGNKPPQSFWQNWWSAGLIALVLLISAVVYFTSDVEQVSPSILSQQSDENKAVEDTESREEEVEQSLSDDQTPATTSAITESIDANQKQQDELSNVDLNSGQASSTARASSTSESISDRPSSTIFDDGAPANNKNKTIAEGSTKNNTATDENAVSAGADDSLVNNANKNNDSPINSADADNADNFVPATEASETNTTKLTDNNSATDQNAGLTSNPQNSTGETSESVSAEEERIKALLANRWTEASTILPLRVAEVTNLLPANEVLPPVTPITPARPKLLAWSIGAFSGTNQLFLDYGGEDAELVALKNDAEQNFWGSSFGLTAEVAYKNRWLASTGLEYHDLWSKLDFESIENTTVELPQTLVQVLVDGNTGNVLDSIFRDTTVNAQNVRTVVHHNQFQLWSVPLEIGIQRQSTRWNYGLRAGLSFNFVAAQKGRTINPELEIVDFDQESDLAPLANFQLGWRLQPFVSYRLTSRLSARASGMWTWYPVSELGVGELSRKAQQLNLQFGLSYRIR